MKRRGSWPVRGKDSYGQYRNAADLPNDFLMGRLRAQGSAPGEV